MMKLAMLATCLVLSASAAPAPEAKKGGEEKTSAGSARLQSWTPYSSQSWSNGGASWSSGPVSVSRQTFVRTIPSYSTGRTVLTTTGGSSGSLPDGYVWEHQGSTHMGHTSQSIHVKKTGPLTYAISNAQPAGGSISGIQFVRQAPQQVTYVQSQAPAVQTYYTRTEDQGQEGQWIASRNDQPAIQTVSYAAPAAPVAPQYTIVSQAQPQPKVTYVTAAAPEPKITYSVAPQQETYEVLSAPKPSWTLTRAPAPEQKVTYTTVTAQAAPEPETYAIAAPAPQPKITYAVAAAPEPKVTLVAAAAPEPETYAVVAAPAPKPSWTLTRAAPRPTVTIAAAAAAPEQEIRTVRTYTSAIRPVIQAPAAVDSKWYTKTNAAKSVATPFYAQAPSFSQEKLAVAASQTETEDSDKDW